VFGVFEKRVGFGSLLESPIHVRTLLYPVRKRNIRSIQRRPVLDVCGVY
jgi:hypothetical protein